MGAQVREHRTGDNNNNVSAVCWHNKTKATQLHRTTVFLSVTVASQSLIEKNFLFPDHSLHRSDWTHGLSSRMHQMIIPIILVSANFLLHLLKDQGTFSSS